ncbi:MAG: hypothetical protein JRG96_14635 [Deltaproteobacteria bacterium]|nr:hypothetical protein [Deltaproteobacteria bacterium]MBW2420113.1 hypothetical protein [Deltaproteobacteria bacterium]
MTQAPSPVELGTVLVSLLDPAPGDEVAFHRWYERDHFYAGCMIGPCFFAGRRFVATRPLKDLRYPARSPVVNDPARGSYLALYWILAGHHAEAERWAVDQVNALIEAERMHALRDPVHAGFYRKRWSHSRDPDGVPAELALDHPYAGVVMTMVDRAAGVDADAIERWYRDKQLPAALPGSPVALCIGLEPIPLPDDAPAYVERPPGLERRLLLLYFLEADPRECWTQVFEPQGRLLAEAGLGQVTWALPFIPTIPGSDRYADELW